MRGSMRTVLVFVITTCCIPALFAQAGAARPRIAVFAPAALQSDAALSAVLNTMADSVELSLAILQRYDVRRVAAADPQKQMDAVRAYCQANRIDQAIVGSGSAQPEGGYLFRLAIYDRRKDSITVDQHGSCRGALDMFDATDALVASLLEGLSGEHLLFGRLEVDTQPPGALVTVNGMDVGPAPIALRGLPTGSVRVAARSAGHEEASASVSIADEQTSTVTLQLARSMGTLRVDIPDDAMVLARAPGEAEVTIKGSGERLLPTGDWEAEASCSGLTARRIGLSIQRNQTATLTPWPRGYVAVDCQPAGTTVVLDGQEKGLSPLMLEVQPGTLHTLELRRAKYLYYRADLSAPAARKVTFQPQLAGSPGSIRIETDPPGADVRVDDGEWTKAPFTLNGISAGTHTVTIDDLLLSRRYYTNASKLSVEVRPEEQATLSVTLVPGTGRLRIRGIPSDGSVTVDGTPLDPARLSGADGAEVPAGQLDLAITTPAGQAWKQSIAVRPGRSLFWDRTTLVASLARRTIKIDGKVNDWDGTIPLWELSGRSAVFPNQGGTHLTRGYLCRDDRFLYVRMDFDDGKPLREPSKDIKGTLCYEMQVHVPEGNVIMNVMMSRQWGTTTWMGFWNASTRSSSVIGNNMITYAAGESSLEFAIPWNFVEKYLKERPFSAALDVVDAGPTSWNRSLVTNDVTIDFVK